MEDGAGWRNGRNVDIERALAAAGFMDWRRYRWCRCQGPGVFMVSVSTDGKQWRRLLVNVDTETVEAM